MKGKLIRKSLKTDVLSVGKLKLADFEKQERQRSDSADSVSAGRMTVNDAIVIHRQRVAGDASLKPRTREYHDLRIAALLKSWPGLDIKQIRSLTKTDCLDWAAKLGGKISATAFNDTIGILRVLLEIGIEMNARYDNPARFIKRASKRPKQLTLPELEQFERFVEEVENGGGGYSPENTGCRRFPAGTPLFRSRWLRDNEVGRRPAAARG